MRFALCFYFAFGEAVAPIAGVGLPVGDEAGVAVPAGLFVGLTAGLPVGETDGETVGDGVAVALAAGVGDTGLFSVVPVHAPSDTAEAEKTVSSTDLLKIEFFI